MIIKLKLNLDKMDKSKLFKGKGGTYLDVTLLENRDGEDSYGNHFMAVQDLPKADREAGLKGAILGNAKKWEKGSAQRPESRPKSAPASQSDDSDPPF